MLNAFIQYNEKKQLFANSDAILVAVSGGIDSVVLLDLFCRVRNETTGYKTLLLGIVHCNFQLRDKESDADEVFVKSLGEKYQIPVFTNRFDTLAYAENEKFSIQMAARKLRYDWFSSVMLEQQFNFLATAHHHNDAVETVLINLIKGTGIMGLHGIAPKKGKVLRPLLFATRDTIEAYATAQNLAHKEDSSNSSEKYVRNKLRHAVIPVLKELNPSIEKTFQENISRISDVETIFKEFIQQKSLEYLETKDGKTYISTTAVKDLPYITTLLFELLKPFDFKNDVVEEVVKGLDGQSGKVYYSATHRLLKDRDQLVISAISETNEANMFLINKDQSEHKTGIQLGFLTKALDTSEQPSMDNSVAFLDADSLQFPLVLRKYKVGDRFQPLGMKGQKKVSDFLIDKKASLLEKENTWVLVSGNDIVWLIGNRIDERFKVHSGTSRVYIVSIIGSF